MLSMAAALDALGAGFAGRGAAQKGLPPNRLLAVSSPARKRSWPTMTSRAAHNSDDDMSEDEAPLSTVAAIAGRGCGSACPSPASHQARREPTLAEQVAEIRAKVNDLATSKAQRLAEEDYMGAHNIHQLIQEQEQQLRALQQQLDARPPSALHTAQPLSERKRRRSPEGQPSKVTIIGRGAASGTVTVEDETGADDNSDAASAEDVAEMSSGGMELEPDDETVEECAGADSAESCADSSQWFTSSSGLVQLARNEQGVRGPNFRIEQDYFNRLYPYQRTGVAWMARLWQEGKGGILADEMGLGKTVQVCAYLNGARKAGATHALLILPVTLLDHWAKECRVWCPGWPVYIYHGQPGVRAQALRRVSRPVGGLLLASYGVIGNADSLYEVAVEECQSPVKRRRRLPGSSKRRRFDDDEAEVEDSGEETILMDPEIPVTGLPPCGSRPWDIVVCDEAHRMKGVSTLLAKSLRQLQANCRLLLTGTPVQNALQDLWALMDFAQPGLLGNHATFIKKFSDPIDKGSVRGATPFAVQLKKHLSEQLRTLMAPHLLRRTKTGTGLVQKDECDPGVEGGAVDDASNEEGGAKMLLAKKETIVWLAPTEEQLTAYQKILEGSDVIREACAKSKLGVEVFRAIGLLKKLCNHPMFVLPKTQVEWDSFLAECAAVVNKEATQMGDPPLALSATEGAMEVEADETDELSQAAGGSTEEEDCESAGCTAVELMLQKLPCNMEAVVQQSSKLRCLASLIPALTNRGHRALVFCQSVRMLDLVWTCCLKPKGIKCLRIDGKTDASERSEKVAKFQSQPERFKVMLLTTAVGGVGLNLTGADRVILVDPAWNPATDAQAVDRAFRIGQTKEVRVYRLIMSGLIEDKMFRLQVFKMGLTKTALEGSSQQRYFTEREIRALFEWVDPALGETRQLLAAQQDQEDDVAVRQDADEDGASDDAWLQAGLVVGLSNFKKLFGAATAPEEEPDAVVAAQVMEAKLKLGEADERTASASSTKEAAIAKAENVAKELEESGLHLEVMKEKRLKAEETLGTRRKELYQARKMEAVAQQRLEKATKAKADAQEQVFRAQQNRRAAEEDVKADRGVEQANDGCRVVEETFAKQLAELDAQLTIVDDSGKASRPECVIDASAEKLKKVAKAREKLKSAMDVLTTRNAELEAFDDDVMKADKSVAEAEAAFAIAARTCGDNVLARKTAELAAKSREKERKAAELAQTKAQQKAETVRETVNEAIQTLVELGGELVDTFVAAAGKKVKVVQVKAVQVALKSVLRQLQSAWKPVKRARGEVLVKAVALRRKALQRTFVVIAQEVDAVRELREADDDETEAIAEEAARRAERGAAELELGKAEGAKANSEMEEAEAKRRRDELKVALPQAREAIKAATRAEKEAISARQQLYAECSRVQRAASAVEEAKNSAIHSLKAEEYDANQVNKNYESKQSKSE